jgi:hypothetical protein
LHSVCSVFPSFSSHQLQQAKAKENTFPLQLLPFSSAPCARAASSAGEEQSGLRGEQGWPARSRRARGPSPAPPPSASSGDARPLDLQCEVGGEGRGGGGAEVREEVEELAGGGSRRRWGSSRRITRAVEELARRRISQAVEELVRQQRWRREPASSSSAAARARFLRLGARRSPKLRPPRVGLQSFLSSAQFPLAAAHGVAQGLGQWATAPPSLSFPCLHARMHLRRDISSLLEGTLPCAFAFSVGEDASHEQCPRGGIFVFAFSYWTQS